MFMKIRNLFKKQKDKDAIVFPEESLGEIAWKSINLENEPIINADLQSIINPNVKVV